MTHAEHRSRLERALADVPQPTDCTCTSAIPGGTTNLCPSCSDYTVRLMRRLSQLTGGPE